MLHIFKTVFSLTKSLNLYQFILVGERLYVMLCYFCGKIFNKQNLFIVTVNVKGFIMIIIIILIVLRWYVPQRSLLHFLKFISIKRHALGIKYANASVKRVDTVLIKQLKHFLQIKQEHCCCITLQ